MKFLDSFQLFDTPTCLAGENASYFTSKVFVHSCLELHMKQKRTIPYDHQANITERLNRDIQNMIIALTE